MRIEREPWRANMVCCVLFRSFTKWPHTHDRVVDIMSFPSNAYWIALLPTYNFKIDANDSKTPEAIFIAAHLTHASVQSTQWIFPIYWKPVCIHVVKSLLDNSSRDNVATRTRRNPGELRDTCFSKWFAMTSGLSWVRPSRLLVERKRKRERTDETRLVTPRVRR